jgi:hypothetical protein
MHQRGNNWSWGLALGLGVLSFGATTRAATGEQAARPVLVTPTVGSESVEDGARDELVAAVERALEAEGYSVALDQDRIGRALIACQTPECIERALDAAHAEFAIVPALWERRGGEAEVTLTLLQREGRNINADAVLGSSSDVVAQALVDELLSARAAVDTDPATPRAEPQRPNAWLAGPVVLLAGGTAAFIAIGVGAATKSESQQFNTTAVATWSAVGAAALAGGIAWWVVGAKRRHADPAAASRAPTLALHPTGIDLRLRF